MHMHRKNSMAAAALTTGRLMPIFANMKGRVSKMRPGPEDGSIPAVKTAGIMAKPAMRANIASKNAVQVPDARRFSFLST